jgi:voltage-gated potassium channel
VSKDEVSPPPLWRSYRGAIRACVVVVATGCLLWNSASSAWTSVPTGIVGAFWVRLSLDTVEPRAITPQTPMGKALERVLQVLGVSLVAVPLGIIIWEMLRARASHRPRLTCRACGAQHLDQDSRYCTRCGSVVV